MNDKTDFEKLRQQLKESTQWPSFYLFKFIVLTSSNNLEQIEKKFTPSDIITKNKSSNGKYISISIKSFMKDENEVINKYMEMGNLEGIISL